MVESTEVEKQKSSHDPHPLGECRPRLFALTEILLFLFLLSFFLLFLSVDSQHILTDISNLCGVLFEGVHNISNVLDIQFHKPTANNFCRTLLCTNANQWSLRANCFND